MDHQKDNQRSIGQDTKGQYQGTSFGDVQNKETMSLSFIAKKSEKLTTALYMVTDIMNDQEPMKWKLRESGVELLSDIMLTATSSSAQRMSLFQLVEKKIEKVISFLDVAWTARMMSEMNAAILKKEYVRIKDTLGKEMNHSALGGTILHESFFEIPHELPAEKSDIQGGSLRISKVTPSDASRANTNVRDSRIETKKDIRSNVQPENAMPTRSSALMEKKDVITPMSLMFDKSMQSSEKDQTVNSASALVVHTVAQSRSEQYVSVNDTPRERPTINEVRLGATRSDANSVARDDRRKIILALIKQKPSLTVKDIVKSIPGYSEKTIQRELLAMVAEGILMKKGERRWSVYSLAQ